MVLVNRFWNHTVRLYREGVRDAWGHVSSSATAIGPAPMQFNARGDQNWSGALQDAGAGEEQVGKRRWFLDKSVPVLERDILAVIRGPEAGLVLRVVSVVPVADFIRVNHTEVNVEIWDGALSEPPPPPPPPVEPDEPDEPEEPVE
jgi:hypothetical protein